MHTLIDPCRKAGGCQFVWGFVRDKHRLLSELIWEREMTLLGKIPRSAKLSISSCYRNARLCPRAMPTDSDFLMSQTW